MDKNMQIATWAIVALIVGGIIGWAIPKGSPQQNYNVNGTSSITSSQVNLRTTMRKLWDDHDVWTRSAILSIASNSGDKDAVIKRLLQNPDDFANALKSYYGADAGSKVGNLLKDHLTIAAELVQASKDNDQAKAKDAESRWFKNANDLAAALAQANSNWSQQDLQNMMYDHLNNVKQEAVDVLHKNWSASIADYDKVHDQTMQMADMLTDGIIKQFPDQFK
jgi:hypothetical protein